VIRPRLRRREPVVRIDREGPWLIVREGRRELGRTGIKNSGEAVELVRLALVRRRYPTGT